MAEQEQVSLELPPAEIRYLGRTEIAHLLGTAGQRVLQQVLQLIMQTATTHQWPLVRLEVRHTHDPEVSGWEYILMVLIFNCSFEIADTYLHELYGQLDAMAERLADEEKLVLQRLIFFDIELATTVPVA